MHVLVPIVASLIFTSKAAPRQAINFNEIGIKIQYAGNELEQSTGWYVYNQKLEQVERLHSEIPHAAPWLRRSKLQILKNCQKFKFLNYARTLYMTHLLMLLDKMYKYEMEPTRTLGATERTRNAGWTDRRTDGRTEWNQYPPPTTSSCGGYKKKNTSHNGNLIVSYRWWDRC